MKGKHLKGLTAGVMAVVVTGSAAFGATSAKRYAIPITTDYETKALLTVGDEVPWSNDTTKSYQMVGIPDGLGAHANEDGTTSLFMNHEFNNGVVSRPLVDGPGYRGSYPTRWTLDQEGDVVSGARSYDTVYTRDTLVGPAAQDDNTTPAFGRLCSGTLAGPAEGFDRPIYIAGEESGPSGAFDSSKGGSAVAFFDNEAHVLPDLGHMSWENAVVERGTGSKTVIMNMEDGPATLDNQIWMYVGTKNPKSSSVLERNGLVGGKLFFFRSLDPSLNSEGTFKEGTVRGEWVEVEGGGDQPESALEAQADAANAMTFIRIEDGAFAKHNPNDFFFVTTGGNDSINKLGRLYELDLTGGDPSTKPAALSVVYNADLITAQGQDIAVSPDNIDTSGKYLMVQEDGTTQSRQWMASQNRDGSIWRFRIGGGEPRIDWRTGVRIVELDPPGQFDDPEATIGPGVWETSGIIDVSGLNLGGGDSWLFDVQAHVSEPKDKSSQIEDGQLLLMTAR